MHDALGTFDRMVHDHDAGTVGGHDRDHRLDEWLVVGCAVTGEAVHREEPQECCHPAQPAENPGSSYGVQRA